MLIRSGKIQFLFWVSFFSALIYLWIVAIGLQTFVLPDEKPMEMPQEAVRLLFVLYGLLIITTLAGSIVSVMINNKFYTRFFAVMVMLVFWTIVASKGIFG